MSTPSDGEPSPRFNVDTIGPEPSGATPIEAEDLEGLIPDFVATRADLNQVEFENITKALPWAQRQARSLGTEGILDFGLMMTLHRRMFGDVWTWAGTQRRRVTNIGVEPSLIATQSRLLLDDAQFCAKSGVGRAGIEPATLGSHDLRELTDLAVDNGVPIEAQEFTRRACA